VVDPHIRAFSLDHSPLHPKVIQRLDLERRALSDACRVFPGGFFLLQRRLKHQDNAETQTAAQGGWRLDYRDPTLDRRVVEFCFTVPLEQFVRGGILRSLARRAMVGRLPASTLNRTQRGRQAADWYASLTEAHSRMLAELDLLERSPLASRTLDLARMRRLIVNWPAESVADKQENTYGVMLPLGFSIGRFLRKYDPEVRQD
jgi:hypothetical protein